MARTPDDPTKAQVWVTKGLDDLDFEFYFPQGPKGDAGGFNNSTAIPAGSDLNNYVFAGTYHVAGADATSISNNPRPTSGIAWTIVVWARSSTVVTQDLHLVNNGMTLKYSRSLVSNIWGPWEVYAPVWVDQTAGRVMNMYDAVNSRKQMIYGDTGRRAITAPEVTSGTMYVRRNGSTVTLYVIGAVVANGTSPYLTALLPAGFKPVANCYYQYREGTNDPSKALIVFSSGDVQIRGVVNGAGGVSAIAMWDTLDPWPTVLPGVASGSVPAG